MPGKRIDELIAAHADGEPVPLAFEFYPPRTADGVANLKAKLPRFRAQDPLYIDMTFGAGGSTSELTMDLCTDAIKAFDLEPNMHLTCTNMPEEKIYLALDGAKAAGIRNIVALRGDPPKGATEWKAVEGGFACALDLIKYIVKTYGKDQFCISTAGYPEGHPNVIKKVQEGQKLSESERARIVTLDDGDYVCSDEDFANEMDYLKEKVDAGASVIITQMFFDTEVFRTFVAACRAAGITVPIIPGLMLVQSAGGFSRMTAFCKTRVPAAVKERIEEVKHDEAAVKAYGMELGEAMCRELIAQGVPVLHFYTLNLEKVTNGVLERLGRLQDTSGVTASAAAASSSSPSTSAAETAAAPSSA